MDNRRRRPWLAALLTFVFCIGIGHIYSGRLKRGVRLFAIGQMLFLASAIALTVIFPGAIFLLVLVALNIAFLIYCIWDAAASAGAGKSYFKPLKYNRWYAYPGFIVIGILLELAVYGIVVSSFSQSFSLPTGSMEPTLLIGDRLLANKWAYRVSEPRRQDLIVYRYPKSLKVFYMKRLIGLPGDVIEIRGRTVYVNGTPLEEAYVQHINPGSIRDHWGPMYIPREGDTIAVAGSAVRVNGEIMDAEVTGPLLDTTADPTKEPYRVAHDYYFVMGDNRDNSRDSRYDGAVSDEYLAGKVFLIYWSFETPRNQYLKKGIYESLVFQADRLLRFWSRTRWDRVFRDVK